MKISTSLFTLRTHLKQCRLEEMNFKQKDLVGIMGGKSSVPEILNKKKRRTIDLNGKFDKIPKNILLE